MMSNEWCAHGPSLNCKDCRIERLTDELINTEQLAKDRYCKMQTEIERLHESIAKRAENNLILIEENERLEAVVDAVKDIKWRSIDKDNMEFATTCFVVDRIRKALAALETEDN